MLSLLSTLFSYVRLLFVIIKTARTIKNHGVTWQEAKAFAKAKVRTVKDWLDMDFSRDELQDVIDGKIDTQERLEKAEI